MRKDLFHPVKGRNAVLIMHSSVYYEQQCLFCTSVLIMFSSAYCALQCLLWTAVLILYISANNDHQCLLYKAVRIIDHCLWQAKSFSESLNYLSLVPGQMRQKFRFHPNLFRRLWKFRRYKKISFVSARCRFRQKMSNVGRAKSKFSLGVASGSYSGGIFFLGGEGDSRGQRSN